MEYNNEDGIWRTVGGKRIFIKDGQSLSEAMRESGKFKKKKKISKKEYGRLARLIDTHKDKWKKGFNSQIIDEKIYFFNYYGYNDYDIVAIEDYSKIERWEDLWKI